MVWTAKVENHEGQRAQVATPFKPNSKVLSRQSSFCVNIVSHCEWPSCTKCVKINSWTMFFISYYRNECGENKGTWMDELRVPLFALSPCTSRSILGITSPEITSFSSLGQSEQNILDNGEKGFIPYINIKSFPGLPDQFQLCRSVSARPVFISTQDLVPAPLFRSDTRY